MNKGPFIEYLRKKITESAANTFTEDPIATPVSKTEELAMLIHSIQFEFTSAPDAPDGAGSVQNLRAQLTDESQTAILDIDSKHVVEKANHVDVTTTSGCHSYYTTKEYIYNPPKIYTKTNIYFGVQSSNQAAAEPYSVKIGYTLEKVSREAFINALVE